MSFELRRERRANGDVFYNVYYNEKHMDGIYAGNDIKDADFQNKDRLNEERGIQLFDKIVASNLTGETVQIIKTQKTT